MKINLKNASIEAIEINPPYSFKVEGGDPTKLLKQLTDDNLSIVSFVTSYGITRCENMKLVNVSINPDGTATVNLREPSEVESMENKIDKLTKMLETTNKAVLELATIAAAGGDK